MPKFDHHIFVCTHVRPEDQKRACCSARNSERVLERFKELLARRKPRGVVRANKSGCLNQCGLGATVVIYPAGVWYGGVTPEDVPEILERHIEKGEIVERLRIPDETLNTPRSLEAP